MQTLGIAATAVVGAGVLVAAVFVVRSIPDFNRYRRLRRM